MCKNGLPKPAQANFTTLCHDDDDKATFILSCYLKTVHQQARCFRCFANYLSTVVALKADVNLESA
jgi:hypothetical protein